MTWTSNLINYKYQKIYLWSGKFETIICSRNQTKDINVQRNSVTTNEPRAMSIATLSVEKS
jgi:hypothetical protein